MRKMLEVKLVSRSNKELFEDEITEFLGRGFELQGDPFIFNHYICQMMVRYDEMSLSLKSSRETKLPYMKSDHPGEGNVTKPKNSEYYTVP